jgi:hypothetical protein
VIRNIEDEALVFGIRASEMRFDEAGFSAPRANWIDIANRTTSRQRIFFMRWLARSDGEILF